MSDEEIVFGDVRFREPERRRRPDRDRKWVCLAYELPGPGDLPIFLDRRPADAIERHALRDTSVELGGILLGKECVDDRTGEPFVWIAKSLEAKHYENTQASFTYTHDSWQEITRERDRLHPDLDIVGWYHTHPDFGIFLSSHDLFIHRHFFAQPLQVAYVLDPIRQTRGFFRWREGRLDQVGGFYLTADRSDRVALARQVNDLENLPNTDVGGGTLSPRLEAELIAMLTRPASHHVTTADRTLTAAIFGLLGALVGALGLAGVLWLNHLGNRVQEQTVALQELEKTVDRSSAAQRLALDTLLDQASVGQPDKFVEKYGQAVRALDESRRHLDEQKTINETLAARAKELHLGNTQLKTDLAVATKKVEQYERDAKEVPELRARLGQMEDVAGRRAKRVAELDALLETIEGRKAAALLRKYDRAWYAAVAGWGLSLLLSLGLLVALINLKVGDEPGPAPEGPPPHRIT
ncbi:MAG TPA: Mov34/MPN/PAD-1 family protein [Isosphaeraceae bacterium]|nr:Mov34/MPN/PAD-1 family protein [Isosphaeraceae bacterium]